ncbi:MAG: hypothetical protein H7Y30_16110 [Pyrinomonadaceae bacterium]|nr:hypothetical protein [Pyrinomonadaceae bacterium]
MSKYLAAALFIVIFLSLIIGSRSASMQMPDTGASLAAPAAVAITYPANGASIQIPTNIFLSADVSGFSNVNRVDFYANGTLEASDTTAPYFTVWNDPAVTTYNLTAVVVENNGAETPSSPVTITTFLNPNIPLFPLPIGRPTLNGVTQGANYTSLTSIPLSATPAGTQYTIARVEFYANTVEIGRDTTPPYEFVWNNPPPGVHSLSARTVVTTSARSSSAPIDIRIIPSSAAAITISDLSPASPYPSSIDIQGLTGAVSSLSVTINNFSHTAPDDVDLLLVSPGGRGILLMSDVGGTTPVNNLSLTFEDTASNPLPDNGPLTSGTFRPTNVGAGDSFPAPAPAITTLSTNFTDFYGALPNGLWSLYAIDDEGNNAGSISGGWSVNISTSTTICGFSITPSFQAFPHTGGSGVINVNATFPNCGWAAVSEVGFLDITSAATGTGSGTVAFTVEPNLLQGRTGTMIIAGRTFSIQQASGCPFALAQETMQVGSGGGNRSVQVIAGELCAWLANSSDNWITVIGGGAGTVGNGTVNFTVAPNQTGSPRTGTLEIGARTLTITQPAMGGGGNRQFDFDGDSKADISVFRPQDGKWYLLLSANNGFRETPFGLGTDKIVPGDYDGDTKTDIAVWRPESGTWHMLHSLDNSYHARQFGQSGDVPIAGDYDGDGKTDLTVFRPATGTWYILQSAGGTLRVEQFGSSEDKPIAGNFDGDAKADLAVFRPSSGTWYVLRSADNSFFAQAFGFGTDRPVAGDYDGDAKTDVAVYRNGTWYVWQSTNNTLRAEQFGTVSDIPAAADYDGDAKADLAVFRPSEGAWYILRSTNGSLHTQQFGSSGDAPIPSAFVP